MTDLFKFILSAVTVCMQLSWAKQALSGHGAIEFMLHKKSWYNWRIWRREAKWVAENHDKISAFHASFHAVIGYRADIASSSWKRMLEMWRWLKVLGGIEDPANPTLALARKYKIPVVVHAGVILELEAMGLDPGELFAGVHVRVENNDEPCKWNDGKADGVLLAGTIAKKLRRTYAVDAGITLDLEHLAIEIGWFGSLGQYMKALRSAVDEDASWPLESVHVCDYDPMRPGFKAGKHLVPGEGILPLEQALRYLVRKFPDVELVLEAPGGVLPFVAGYIFGLGRKRAIENAKRGLGFIYGCFG